MISHEIKLVSIDFCLIENPIYTNFVEMALKILQEANSLITDYVDFYNMNVFNQKLS